MAQSEIGLQNYILLEPNAIMFICKNEIHLILTSGERTETEEQQGKLFKDFGG